MLHKDLLSSFKVSAYKSRYKMILCHNVLDNSIVVREETKITVCKDTDQLTLFVNYRHARDLVLAHKSVSLGNSLVGCK